MSDAINDILGCLREYEQTPEARGVELRLSLARLIMKAMDDKGLTLSDLAVATKIPKDHLGDIIHSNVNCTLERIGRILHALGIRAEFSVVENTTA